METIYSWQEKLKKRSLLILLLSFFYLWLLGFLFAYYLTGEALTSVIISFFLSTTITGYQVWKAYTSPQSIVESITHAYPANDRKLLDAVEKMKLAYGIKNVEVYTVPWPIINAFVVSKKDKHFLFVTEGAIDKLDNEELENVLAHEFAHMENGDSLVMTTAVIVAGLVVLLSYMILRSVEYRRREDRAGSVVFLAVILMSVLSPLVTRMLVSALSKEREFLADARAVQVTKYPPGLINALVKVAFENSESFIEKVRVPKTFGALFFDYEDIETHPPIYQRIRRIAEITKTPVDEKLLRKLEEMGI